MRAPARKPTVVPGRGTGRRPRDAGLLGFAASRIGGACGCGPGERIRREEELEVCGGWVAPPAKGSSDGGERARADRMGIEEDVKSEGGRWVREIWA
jgi:hypothetical protein